MHMSNLLSIKVMGAPASLSGSIKCHVDIRLMLLRKIMTLFRKRIFKRLQYNENSCA